MKNKTMRPWILSLMLFHLTAEGKSPASEYEKWNIVAPSRAENAKLLDTKLVPSPAKELCLKAFGLSFLKGDLVYQEKIGNDAIERVNLLVIMESYTKDERKKLYEMFPDLRDRMTVYRTTGTPEFGERRLWNIEKSPVGCLCSFSDFSAAVLKNGGLTAMSDSTPLASRVCEALSSGSIPTSGKYDDN